MMGWQVGSQTLPGCLEKCFVLSFSGHNQHCPSASVCPQRRTLPNPVPSQAHVRCDYFLS